MLRTKTIIFATAMLCFAGPALGDDALQVAPIQGVLVLRNGNVLRGAVSRSGERYYVALDEGEIRVKAADVELYCKDLDEAYHLKAGVLSGQRFDEHLRLAEWCISQGLLGYAARELVKAQSLNPGHPHIALVERRVRLAIQPVKRRDASPESDAGPREKVLDELSRNLPAGSVEAFTNDVQPLLINRCGMGGCHGPQSKSAFQLERISSGRPLTRRVTQRNLLNLLKQVDRQKPASSPLLTKPLEPHGTAADAIFTEHDIDQYQQLVAWVHRLSRPVRLPQPENVESKSAPLLQKFAPTGASPFGISPRPAYTPSGTKRPNMQREKPAQKTAQGHAGSESTPQRTSPQRGAPLAQPGPQDPFDPEVFNRRYSNRR